MASELRVDRIIPTSGVPTNGGGSILQIMPVYGLANTLTTSTTTSYASMGLSGTITPLRTDSKIYISIYYKRYIIPINRFSNIICKF